MIKVRSFFKKLLLSVSIILLIIIISAILFLFFNKEYLKNNLVNELNKISGFKYSAETINIVFSPEVTVIMNNVSIAYVKTDQSVNILRVDRLEADFSWADILRKNFKIKNIFISKGTINVYTDLFSGTDSVKPGSDILSEINNITLRELSLYFYNLNPRTVLKKKPGKNSNPSGYLTFDKLTINFPREKKTDNLMMDIEITKLLPGTAEAGDSTLFTGVNIKSGINCSFMENQITFNNAEVNCGSILDAVISGYISLNNKPGLSLTVKANDINPNRLVKLVADFIELKPEADNKPGSKFISNIDIYSMNMYLFNRFCSDFTCRLDITDNNINIKESTFRIYHGQIKCRGSVKIGNPSDYKLQLSSSKMDIEKPQLSLINKKYISGLMDSDLNLRSQGNSFEILKENLISEGRIIIWYGELIDYADFLKPLFSLGKLVNVLGPKGDSTGFEELVIDYSIVKKKVKFNKVKMKGVGLDAEGYGTLGFNGSINMRIEVGLGGLAGKIIKVPVIYKGMIPENKAYVDPFWIGSIYVGMVVIPGPPGAIIGPTVYESMRDLYREFNVNINPFSKKQ